MRQHGSKERLILLVRGVKNIGHRGDVPPDVEILQIHPVQGLVLGAYYLVNAHVGGIGAPLFGFLAQGVGIATAFNWIGIAFVAMSGISLVIGRRFAR